MIALAIVVVVGLLALIAELVRRYRRAARRFEEAEQLLGQMSCDLASSDQRQAESIGRYRSLFESVPVAIIATQPDGVVLDINKAGIEVFGYADHDEFLKINASSLYVNPADRERRVAEVLKDSEEKATEYLMRRKDGTTFAALTQIRVIFAPSGTLSHFEWFVSDLTEYKRLEVDRRTLEHEQRISARLKSVGALAAGIAHEINTPMQFVSDSIYFLKSALYDLDPIWPRLAKLAGSPASADSAVEAIQGLKDALQPIDVETLLSDANESTERALLGIRRITTIIRAMREFAHPDNGEQSNVDLNKAIEMTLTVCKNVYKEVADVETEYGELPPVMCQFGEINQVLLNIIVNAAHAIEARKNVESKGMIRIMTTVDGPWAVIRIGDNGTGMPESVKARIFDPFFTTKEVGKGTGQGLAIVQSVIVERHRGRISVDTEIGQGTVFTLRLPIISEIEQTSGVVNE